MALFFGAGVGLFALLVLVERVSGEDPRDRSVNESVEHRRRLRRFRLGVE